MESDSVKIETIYQDMGPKANPRYKFSHFKATVGDTVYDPIPIKCLRVSELQVLHELLDHAYNAGFNEAVRREQA